MKLIAVLISVYSIALMSCNILDSKVAVEAVNDSSSQKETISSSSVAANVTESGSSLSEESAPAQQSSSGTIEESSEAAQLSSSDTPSSSEVESSSQASESSSSHMPAVVHAPGDFSAYFIGNSLTDNMRYNGLQSLAESRGHTHNWGRHMIPGAPLTWLWDHRTEGFQNPPYGYPETALPNYSWDAITLQPFDRLIGHDTAAIANYVRLAAQKSPNVQFYIYSHWHRKPKTWPTADDSWGFLWNRNYTGSWDNTFETKDYFEKLLAACNEKFTNVKPFLIIPVGDVMYELNQKMRRGEVPGHSEIWDVYTDGIHLNKVGAYIAGLTFYATLYKESPVGLPSDYTDYAVSPELAVIIQEVVWQVVSNHPHSGVTGENILITTYESLPSTFTGSQYMIALSGIGGSGDYRWSVTDGALPVGITIEETTGIMSGRSETAGDYSFELTMHDAVLGKSISKRFTLSVTVPEAIAIVTDTLAIGFVGYEYSFEMQYSGGYGTAVWTILSGNLPGGLVMDSVGIVKGAPIEAVEALVMLEVRDENNIADTAEVVIKALEKNVQGLTFELYKQRFDSAIDYQQYLGEQVGIVSNFTLDVTEEVDNFGLRFMGFINITTSGTYTFYTGSDDGSILTIGDSLVVDNDGPHAYREVSGTIELTAGYHAIEVVYFERTGGELFDVKWQAPGGSKQAIPDDVLFFEVPR